MTEAGAHLENKEGVRNMIEALCDGDKRLPGRRCWQVGTLRRFGAWANEEAQEIARH